MHLEETNFSWVNFHNKVKSKYFEIDKHLWWGDDLDVRFYLLKQLSEIQNKKILDIGCNVGITLNLLNKTNKLYGIDVDNDCIVKAKNLVKNAQIIRASMDKLPYDDKSFDIIIMMNVMPYYDFHLSAADRKDFITDTFNEAYRVLRDDGIIYLTTPNGSSVSYINCNKASIDNVNSALEKFDLNICGWNNFKPLFPMLPRKFKFFPPKILCKFEFIWKRMASSLSFDEEKSKYFYIKAKKILIE